MTENGNLQTLLNACSTDLSGQFRAVYDVLLDKVYAYTRYRVSTEEQAVDLVQDIFIDLYEALPKFTYQSDAQFYSFVFTITKRKLAKHYAKQNTEHLDGEKIAETDIPSPDEDTATKDAIHRALAKLDEETREIVVLHHWSKYTFPEIASLLNLTESAVRVRHHRALKSLAVPLTNQS